MKCLPYGIRFIFYGRGRRTWSRLPARSALLLRRGLHRRPAPLDTLRVPRLQNSFAQHKKQNGHLAVSVSFFMAGAEGLEPSARGFGVHPEVLFLVLITVIWCYTVCSFVYCEQ